jgi:hypothetical protein
MYSTIASYIIVSAYVSIAREVAFVGLHVDELEESEIPGQVPCPAKFSTIYVTGKEVT